jgi:hypothetical protein
MAHAPNLLVFLGGNFFISRQFLQVARRKQR